MARSEGNLPVRRGQDQWLSPSTGADLWQTGSFLNASPWQVMRRMQEDMDRMFGQFFPTTQSESRGWQGTHGLGAQSWAPSVDVSEDPRGFVIEVDLPGVNKDNIEVETQNGQFRIRAELKQETPQNQGASKGQTNAQGQGGDLGQRQYLTRERRYGYFERVFTLPENVKEDAINCEFRDGVLVCHLPKSEERAQQGRRIPVGEGSQTPRLQTSQAGGKQQEKKAA